MGKIRYGEIEVASRKKNLPLPSKDELARLLTYDPITGEFLWKERAAALFANPKKAGSWNTQFAGKPAFTTKNGNGYLCGYIDYQKLYAHRVAWKMVHGTEVDQIDHINGDRSDNRICNLEAATNASNCRNARIRTDNTSGVTGVGWDTLVNKWHARITVDGAIVNLGRFKTFNEAVIARKAAERIYSFHPNHGRKTKT